MAPRKLSDSDKGSIVELYKQPGQTTSTLAEQYGVSNSTISRILKMNLPAEEYRALVSQKRMGSASDKANASTEKETASTTGRRRRSRKSASSEPVTAPEPDSADTNEDPSDADSNGTSERSVAPPKLKTAAEKEAAKTTSGRRRRRTTATTAPEEDEQLPLLAADLDTGDGLDSDDLPESQTLGDEADDDEEDDDLLGLDETLGDDFGDDDDELDDDELDDDADDSSAPVPKPKLQVKTAMQIMPLGEAVLPKPCYLVIDMRSELITRPLIEFADLGQIPSEEERAKTLPVFDNHRVARRFSRNKQRVIKVPDGSLITRTSPYLAAKGITRLLVDGQVFDLASNGIED